MKTKIEWCDYTINPVKGLCPVDCKDNQRKSYCYSRRLYKRFKWNPEIRFDGNAMTDFPNKPSRIFVGSTIELFGDWVKPEWMEQIMALPSNFPQHTFIFLTKQPQNLIKWSPFPDNCWVGVSLTNNGTFLRDFERVNAKVKFLSIEPLLKWENLPHQRDMFPNILLMLGINWVIIGQQTPVKQATMPKIEWIQEIVDACDKAGVAVFLKNNLVPLFNSQPSLPRWAVNDKGLRQELPR